MNLTLLGASLYLACGGAVFALGLIVLREAPGERLRRVTAAMMFFGGFGPLIGGLGMLLAGRGGSALLETDLATAFAYVWEFFFPSLLLFALVFPREHPLLSRYRRFAWILFFPYVFHLGILLSLGRLTPALAGFHLDAPFGIAGSIDQLFHLVGGLLGLLARLLARFHVRFFSLVDLVTIGAALLLLFRSLRADPAPKIRRQLRVILFGLGTCVGLYAVAVPIPTLLSTAMPHGVRMVLLTAALLVGTGSIGFAIIRASFLEVGTVFRRAILFSATFGSLVLGFLVLARQMDGVLRSRAGTEVPLFQGLFVLLAVVFFHPVLNRIDRAVDRVLAGDRIAHHRLLRDLARELTSIFDLAVLSGKTVRSLRGALAVDAVHLFLRDRSGEGFTDAAGDAAEPVRFEDGHPLARALARVLDPLTARDLADEVDAPAGREAVGHALRGLGAEVAVPIHLPEGGETLGFILLGPKVTGSRFSGEEVGLLSMLAAQIAFAVRNARLHEEAVERRLMDEEMIRARAVQESIVPRRSADVFGIEVAAVNLPSRHVGGDYYDLVPLGEGGLGIAVGDVSGKGFPAALLMSMLHAALHVQMNGDLRADALLGRLNRILCRSTAVEQFATFFFGVYRRKERDLRFCNGGHNPPFVLRADGAVETLTEGGTVLGFLDEALYVERTASVGEGDLVVFYTDGVTEEAREDDEQFGEERLIETVRRNRTRSAREIVGAVEEAVTRFAGRDRFADDFTLIVLRGAGEAVA